MKTLAEGCFSTLLYRTHQTKKTAVIRGPDPAWKVQYLLSFTLKSMDEKSKDKNKEYSTKHN